MVKISLSLSIFLCLALALAIALGLSLSLSLSVCIARARSFTTKEERSKIQEKINSIESLHTWANFDGLVGLEAKGNPNPSPAVYEGAVNIAIACVRRGAVRFNRDSKRIEFKHRADVEKKSQSDRWRKGETERKDPIRRDGKVVSDAMETPLKEVQEKVTLLQQARAADAAARVAADKAAATAKSKAAAKGKAKNKAKAKAGKTKLNAKSLVKKAVELGKNALATIKRGNNMMDEIQRKHGEFSWANNERFGDKLKRKITDLEGALAEHSLVKQAFDDGELDEGGVVDLESFSIAISAVQGKLEEVEQQRKRIKTIHDHDQPSQEDN
jgi:hypothetical protein